MLSHQFWEQPFAFDPDASLMLELATCRADQYGVLVDKVAGLLGQGASPDVIIGGRTALHFAAMKNGACVIPMLVTPVNLNSLGFHNATPLMLAAARGHTQAVEALLAAGADMRPCTDTGRTALGASLAQGHFAAALRLLRHAQLQPDCDAILAAAVTSASPDLDRGDLQHVHLLAKAAQQGYHQLVPLLVTPLNLNMPAGAGQLTPLHLALKHGHVAAAEALLDAGAAVNIPDLQGHVPLAYAVQRNQPQLHVRLLQAMKQQQQPTAAGGHSALMEPVITAAAWLSSNQQHASCTTRLFAAVMAAWGSDAVAELLRGLLKRLASNRHYLAEALLLGWRQAQRKHIDDTQSLIDRLQRLVLDPLASRRQQQDPQQQRPLPNQDRALRLRLPLALLLQKAGQGRGQAHSSAPVAPWNATLAAHMAGPSLDTDSSQAAAIAAAAGRGSLAEVAGLLGAVPTTQQPAVLLVAAQAAGTAGDTRLLYAVLQQFAALDWQAAPCSKAITPYADLVWASAAAQPTTTSAAATSSAPSDSGSQGVAGAPIVQGNTQQQRSPGHGASFCLYGALLECWQGAGQAVLTELMQQVVAVVEAATPQAEGAA